MIFVFVAYATLIIALFWFVACSQLSYDERNKALDDKKLTWVDILEVEFYKHVWYKFTFRDPWKLYNNWVQVRIKRDR